MSYKFHHSVSELGDSFIVTWRLSEEVANQNAIKIILDHTAQESDEVK